MIKIIIFFISIVSFSTPSYSDIEDRFRVIDAYGYKSMQFAILNSTGREDPPNDVSGLLIFLGSIDDDNARKLLVDLTSYYLGSATSEALQYSIVRHGEKILPNLTSFIDRPVKCIKKALKECLSLKERNNLIRGLIGLIKSGDKLDYVL